MTRIEKAIVRPMHFHGSRKDRKRQRAIWWRRERARMATRKFISKMSEIFKRNPIQWPSDPLLPDLIYKS